MAESSLKAGIKHVLLRILPQSVLLPLKKSHYFKLLRHLDLREEKDFAVIEKLVKPGELVIDIGANYGVYMKFLAGLVGKDGLVVSVEPIPDTFAILSSNAKKLDLKNVKLLNNAFSDRKEEMVMEIPTMEKGGENYYMAKIVDGGSTTPGLRKVTIKSVTLDSQFASASRAISFIKCDVEGHELPCIRGAMESLGKWKPSWCVEVNTDPDEPAGQGQELFRIFQGQGYGVYWFDGTRLKQWKPGARSVNYFFLTERHLELVRDILG